MTPDIEKYGPFLARFDLTEDQKSELMNIIWRLMEGFADRAFGLNSVQQVRGAATEKGAKQGSPVLEFVKVSSPHVVRDDTFQMKPKKERKRR